MAYTSWLLARTRPSTRSIRRAVVSRASNRFGWLDLMSLIVAGLMVATSLLGLVTAQVYRDNNWSTAAFRGTDAITLTVVVPVLVIALMLARRGSLRARLVWLGVLAYNVYNYGFYLFGAAFNDLFLYAAALGLSVLLLAFAVPRLVPGIALQPGARNRLVGGYLIAIGGRRRST